MGLITIRFTTYWWSFGTSIFNGFRYIQWRICDAMVDMTLNDLYAKVKVIHFGTNQFFHIRLSIGCQ